MSEMAADERKAAVLAPVRVGGQTVLLVPHREPDVEESALPPDYQRVLALVRQAGGPVVTRQVGEALGLDTETKGKLEPLRAKLTRLAERGLLRKLADGRFTTRL